MSTANEDPAPYTSSSEAYRAIHRAAAFAVRAHLEDADFSEAVATAALMREIEEHTDVD